MNLVERVLKEYSLSSSKARDTCFYFGDKHAVLPASEIFLFSPEKKLCSFKTRGVRFIFVFC